MRLCLVEDLAVAGLEPLTLTRPMYELWLGCSTLGCKIASAFGIGPGPQRRGSVVRSHLVAVQRQRDPHMVVNDRDWLAREPVIVANARWIPPAGFEPPDSQRPWVGLCDGQPACALVDPEDAVALDPHGIDSWFDTIVSRYSGLDVGGEWIFRPWDLVARNGAYIERDFREAKRSGVTNRQLATLALVGPSNLLRVHETRESTPTPSSTRRTAPSLSLPTSGSSHSLASRAPVTSDPRPNFSGPTSGARSRSARTAGSAARSRTRSCTVSPTSTTRAFWGTPILASGSTWCAITSNSDLRNDYGEVFVPLQGDPVPTGQAKVGCFIGDHTRTGMGSMLNTGTAIGVMCNVLPAGLLLPKHVPSFTAVLYGRVGPGFSLDQMFATARIVMGRGARPSPMPRSSSTAASSSRPGWNGNGPSSGPTTTAPILGRWLRRGSDLGGRVESDQVRSCGS